MFCHWSWLWHLDSITFEHNHRRGAVTFKPAAVTLHTSGLYALLTAYGHKSQNKLKRLLQHVIYSAQPWPQDGKSVKNFLYGSTIKMSLSLGKALLIRKGLVVCRRQLIQNHFGQIYSRYCICRMDVYIFLREFELSTCWFTIYVIGLSKVTKEKVHRTLGIWWYCEG